MSGVYNPEVELYQHVVDDMAMDVCETAFEAVVVVAQALVVQAEKVKYGGVKIIDSGDVLLGFPAEGICGAVGVAALYACAGQPTGEAVGVVIASARAFLEGRHAAKLGAPHDKGVL